MDEPEYDADGTPTNEAGRFERFATEAWSDIKKSWNPIYAWSVIARSRKDDGTYFPLPDWCREYLSAVADGMIKHADQHSKEAKGTGAAIPPILFMSRSGWNAFKDFKADKRRKKLANSFIYGHFHPRRHQLAACIYRAIRSDAFNVWHQETCIRQAA